MQGKPKTVAVVITAYNGMKYLPKCLERLAKAGYPHTVIVVDGGSSDGTVEYLKGLEGMVFLRTEGDVGYAGTLNVGLRHALAHSFDYCLAYGTDVEAPAEDGGWLQRMVEKAESDPRIGMVAPKLVYPDGRVQSLGMGLGSDGRSHPITREGETPAFLPYTCTLIKRETLVDIGLPDEEYYFYFDDVDQGFAARWRGWKLAVEPSAVLVHHEGKLSGGINKPEAFTHSRKVFMGKWGFMLEPGWEAGKRVGAQSIRLPELVEIDRLEPPARTSRNGMLSIAGTKASPGTEVRVGETISISVPSRDSYAGIVLTLNGLGNAEHMLVVEAMGSDDGIYMELGDPESGTLLDGDFTAREWLRFEFGLPRASRMVSLNLTTYSGNRTGTLQIRRLILAKAGEKK